MTIIDVVFIALVNLDSGVLGVNLPFDETLENFGNPNIKADLSARRDNFKTEVFLNATRVFELGFVAQDAVKRGK